MTGVFIRVVPEESLMKHSVPVTALLVGLFFLSQIVGLGLISYEASKGQLVDTPEGTRLEYPPTAIGARPNLEPHQVFLLLVIGVGIGTALVLFLIKVKAFRIWKYWFLLAVFLSLFVAFKTFMFLWLAFALAIFATYMKIYRPNIITHNLTEIFIYGGIALLISPLFNVLWVAILLLAISLYDMYAVWHSKHMVKLAKAQTDNNLFAGLFIPKNTKKSKTLVPPQKPKKDSGVAILGGGDLAFPLIFSGSVLTWLVEKKMGVLMAFQKTLIITLFAGIALSLLFILAKKGKFYPAMPFINMGCFAGFAVILLL